MNKKNIIIHLIQILLIIIFSISLINKSVQNDTFFTIALGERVLEYGIEKEEKLVWHEGLEYTNSRWLFDITVSKIYELFDWNGVYAFVMVCTIIQGVLLYTIINKITKKKILAFISTLIIMNLSANQFAARSQIISFIIFIIEFYLVEKLVETNKNRYMVALAIFAFLLVNIHASVFPMYFVIYLPYIAAIIIKKLKIKTENKLIIEVKYEIKLIISMVISFLLGFCVPEGMSPYTDMFKAMGGVSTTFISELQPLDIMAGWVIFATIGVVVAIIAFTKTKVRVVDCLFILGFAIMALYTYRCCFFYYLIAGISIVRILNDFIDEYNINFDFINSKLKILIYIVLTIIILVKALNNLCVHGRKDYIDSSKYPIGATAYILNNINLDEMRIYNHFNFGSYLELNGIKAFIDSRSGVFTEEFNPGTTILDEWLDVINGGTHYKVLFEKYDITHALLYNTELVQIYIYDNPEWNLIYQDDNFSLYEKVSN